MNILRLSTMRKATSTAFARAPGSTDNLRLGFSGYRQGDAADRQTLGGVDATLRFAPSTYLDIEGARSDGSADQLSSIDGGFGFNQRTTPDGRADAKRVQGVFDLSELSASARGRGSIYWQDRDSGFSGAGALASGDRVEQKGAAFSVPLGQRLSADLKVDERDANIDPHSRARAPRFTSR